MTNEEKALEFCRQYAVYDKSLKNSGVARTVALQMAYWKDEQYKEQRKKLIEKAKEYLSITYDFVASEQAKKETNKEKVIEGFIKAMEE